MEKETWNEIEDEYGRDEYPVFGGPFTDARTPWQWLRDNYHPPVRKDVDETYKKTEDKTFKRKSLWTKVNKKP